LNTRTVRLSVLAALAAVLGTLGCDSTQPDQITSQPANLSVEAFALVDNNNCWEIWVDTDGNAEPDLNTGQYFCTPVVGETKVNRAVPWRYSMVVSVLRAGATVPEVIGSSVAPKDGIQDFVSMSPYDSTMGSVADLPPDGDVYYINGKQVSSGSAYYLNAVGYNLGLPNVLQQTPTFDFSLNPGDTVIVQARKQPYADAPPYLNFDQDPDLTISGLLYVAGIKVPLSGSATSSGADKSGISFSFSR
jgi:hypothetical protein